VSDISTPWAVDGIRVATARLWALLGGHRSLLFNAGTLFGSTLLTAGIGSIYWAIAARVFPATAVGVGAAAISSMQLIGQVATFGLGTVLMGELAGHRASKRSLIDPALAVTALVGAGLAALFVLLAGAVVPDLVVLRAPLGIVLFAIGVAATAAGLVLDQALLGLLRGGLQLLRNGIASVAKLVALVVIGLLALGGLNGLSLLFTWVVGGVVSMTVLVALPGRSTDEGARAVWRAIDGVAGLAIRHHALNLAILAPGLLLPLVITGVLSAEANAYFYIAYLIASFAWAIPAALATAVYAAGSRDIDSLSARVRLALGLSIATGIVLNLLLLVAAQPLLSIFGPEYASRATTLLRLFGLGIFPVTINSLFVPIARVERRFLQGTTLMVLSMAIEFAVVVLAARAGGLEGAGVGWLVGYSLSVLPFVPTIVRVAARGSVVRIDRDLFGPVPSGAGRGASVDGDV
jgi:O-antigen/teichoic acid export membrane protein